ncbi:MAG: class I SAM-dependent methyltransferase [Bacteroidales bacterium]|nr:class I SAM-dependent methyltransferase [Bacteroidales bacterium]
MQEKKSFGSDEVKAFYNSQGWKKSEDGKFYDTQLFGNKFSGKIIDQLERLRIKRVREVLENSGTQHNFIEAGCGANPAIFVLDLCDQYTGVDFSSTGLHETGEILKMSTAKHQLVEADICEMPFQDETFDTSYSAHVIYHIPSKSGQRQAFDEILRVTKKGGKAIFILANPRPLLFPIRLIKRLIIDTPFLDQLINGVRPKAVLPYKPQTIKWMKRKLGKHGDVKVISFGLSSTYIKRNVSEKSFFGRLFWKTLYWLEYKAPKTSAYLGNYVMLVVTKS